jgi:hypothetical protein
MHLTALELTESDYRTLAAALHVAADVYRQNAAMMRLRNQNEFVVRLTRQAMEADELRGRISQHLHT